MFHMANEEFEDCRFTFEEWGKEKMSSRFPFNSMPIVEDGDKTIA